MSANTDTVNVVQNGINPSLAFTSNILAINWNCAKYEEVELCTGYHHASLKDFN